MASGRFVESWNDHSSNHNTAIVYGYMQVIAYGYQIGRKS